MAQFSRHSPVFTALLRANFPSRAWFSSLGIVRPVRRNNLPLHCRVSFTERALRWPVGVVVGVYSSLSCSHVVPRNDTFKEFQSQQRLIERNFVATLIHTREAKLPTLLNLSIHPIVTGRNVFEPGIAPTWSADELGNLLNTWSFSQSSMSNSRTWILGSRHNLPSQLQL